MTYSLEKLLKVQSPTFKKHPDFLSIARLLATSPALTRVRLNQRAYRLLNEPRLELRYLVNFYTTYRVPKSDFFTIFLSIKWEHVQKRSDKRSARDGYIASRVAAFPRDFLALFTFLVTLENGLYPRTKKRVNELSAYTLTQWLSYFTSTIKGLMKKQRVLEKIGIETLLACMLLECLPDFSSGKLPQKAIIKKQYRKLSKEYHPDLCSSYVDGDKDRFLLVKKAYDDLS